MRMQSSASLGAFLVAGLSVSALAGISQSTLVSPGGFIQAGADPGPAGSAFGWPGQDLAGMVGGAGASFDEGFFGGIGVVTRSASATGTNINNNATGTCGMGYVLLDAFNNAPNNSSGPVGAVNGGWKDTFTIFNPAHTGESGFLVFDLNASGFLKATGFAGSASIRVTGYKDNVQLLANALFSPGNSDLISTDRQYGNWAIATYGNPNVDSKSFNDSATFAVPFTFGTPFTLGIYAWSKASMRSQSGVAGNSTALVEGGVVRWGGILNILAGATSVTATSTVSSATGKDWGPGTQPPDPCPGDLNLDGFVDDADFVLFVASYNILDCADPSMPANCIADLNGDGFVDDADFVEFVVAYNNLTCV
ncbi:MAG: dockerin type I repeat-containing protein [Phycisphaeraceae bacterium]|nr:dockerin type I repeat-containing protein [Phycisphaeraceae bacterium]